MVRRRQARTGGDVEVGDDIVGDVVELLDEGAEGVAVRGHEDVLAVEHVLEHVVVPEGHHALERSLERLGNGRLLLQQRAVAHVVARVVRGVLLQRGRGDVVAAAPHVHLVLPVLGHRLVLVQALQRAVVPLVQLPRLLHRDPHQVHLRVSK